MSHYNRRARHRFLAQRNFKRHFSTYLIMGLFFFVLNMVTSPWVWWFYWPMLGWGIGIAFHYLKAYELFGHGAIDEETLEKEIAKYEKEERQDKYLSKKKEEEEYLELKDLQRQRDPEKVYRDEDLV